MRKGRRERWREGGREGGRERGGREREEKEKEKERRKRGERESAHAITNVMSAFECIPNTSGDITADNESI